MQEFCITTNSHSPYDSDKSNFTLFSQMLTSTTLLDDSEMMMTTMNGSTTSKVTIPQLSHFHSGITDEMIKNIIAPPESSQTSNQHLMLEHLLMLADGGDDRSSNSSSLHPNTYHDALTPSSSVLWNDISADLTTTSMCCESPPLASNTATSSNSATHMNGSSSSSIHHHHEETEITTRRWQSESSSRRFSMKNQEEVFRIIDEELRHVHSSLGLKWSMLNRTTSRPSVSCTNNHLTPNVVESKFHVVLNPNHTFKMHQKNDEQLHSNVLPTTSKNTNQLHTAISQCIIPEMMSTISSQNKNQHIDSTLESSDSSTCSSSTFVTATKKKTRKSTSQTKISKSNKTSQMHPSMKYRVRFGHNLFEEITFKKTNPHQKFIIFK
ncbi:hypothetical protein C9374_000457 [Naegleria lovaniensis]|uniref:Uncharacterized protein n=1 Tax=Naegleria lovaniensis TaxID=51637 RepID=A0AA88GXQ0_NAELO|nr:uncharacterized protein C9374_000457 [Naegleria lovaniensis]KAG2388293.1 hypothetical protein C9374_000457 [Naegleria lovaniensis]